MSEADMTVAGDGDNWMLLERASAENLPIVVRTRINPEIDEISKSGAIVAVICDVQPHFVQDNGMPSSMTELYELEDRVVALVTSSRVKAYHTASATGDAHRVIYFVIERGVDIGSAVSGASSDVAIVSVYDDIDLEVYRDFATPSNLDKQVDGDRQVIAVLEDNGDQLHVPREVEFFFYGPRKLLESLLKEALDHGFVFGSWLDESGGLLLHRMMPVEASEFHNLTPTLLELCERLGVTYDGWGTPMAATKAPEVKLDPPKSSLLARLFGSKKN